MECYVCCSEDLLKKAGHIARDQLLSFGTCFGKFTKTSKFRVHITALDFLAPYAKVLNTMYDFFVTLCWVHCTAELLVTYCIYN